MNKKITTLLVSILIPLAVGQISAMLTQNGLSSFSQINMPALMPPFFIFPIVWTILYILMGISSYIVFTSHSHYKKSALQWYFVQLFLNFMWSIIFFNLQNYLASFILLLVLIACIIIMIVQFYRVNPIAAYLQIPYLLWCIFAAYLNFQIIILN